MKCTGMLELSNWTLPHRWYHGAGLTSVNVRVCGSPGRDKMGSTDKKAGTKKKEEGGECGGVQ